MTHRDLRLLEGGGHLRAVPDLGDIAEQVDNGVRLAGLALAESPSDQQPVTPEFLARRKAAREQEPLPVETLKRLATDAAEARSALDGGLRYLKLDEDRIGADEVRAEFERALKEVDRLAARLAERFAS